LQAYTATDSAEFFPKNKLAKMLAAATDLPPAEAVELDVQFRLSANWTKCKGAKVWFREEHQDWIYSLDLGVQQICPTTAGYTSREDAVRALLFAVRMVKSVVPPTKEELAAHVWRFSLDGGSWNLTPFMRQDRASKAEVARASQTLETLTLVCGGNSPDDMPEPLLELIITAMADLASVGVWAYQTDLYDERQLAATSPLHSVQAAGHA